MSVTCWHCGKDISNRIRDKVICSCGAGNIVDVEDSLHTSLAAALDKGNTMKFAAEKWQETAKKWERENADLRACKLQLVEAAEQRLVQLAGCSTAAMGATHDPARRGDWGWSVAYQDVLDLRFRMERAEAEVARLQQERDDAIRLLERAREDTGTAHMHPPLYNEIASFLRRLPGEETPS